MDIDRNWYAEWFIALGHSIRNIFTVWCMLTFWMWKSGLYFQLIWNEVAPIQTCSFSCRKTPESGNSVNFREQMIDFERRHKTEKQQKVNIYKKSRHLDMMALSHVKQTCCTSQSQPTCTYSVSKHSHNEYALTNENNELTSKCSLKINLNIKSSHCLMFTSTYHACTSPEHSHTCTYMSTNTFRGTFNWVNFIIEIFN